MGAGRGCLAVGELGGIPRCRAARPEDPAAGSAARGAVVDLRARSRRLDSAQADHPRAAVHVSWRLPSRRPGTSPFDFAVVDEAQDLSVAHLRFLAALGGDRPNACSSPATSASASSSSRSPGSRSASIFAAARARCASTTAPRTRSACRPTACSARSDATWTATARDRSDTVSVFNGPPPTIRVLDRPRARRSRPSAAGWPSSRKPACCRTRFGVFVRSAGAAGPCARRPSKRPALPFKVLDEHVETASGHVSISTMHLAKGLEFRAVAVMACDDEVIPLQERIETVGDDADLAGGLRHRAAPALRRLHAGPGSSAGHGRRAGIGVP